VIALDSRRERDRSLLMIGRSNYQGGLMAPMITDTAVLLKEASSFERIAGELKGVIAATGSANRRADQSATAPLPTRSH
jgi:hypothetical protein